MKNSTLFILYISFLGLLTSCNKNMASTYESVGGQSKSSSSKIDFAMVNSQVLQPMCVNCHKTANGNSGGINLETYQNVYLHKAQIRQEVATGGMPTSGPGLNATEKNLILTWIDDGAPEFVAGLPTPTPTPTPVPTPTPTPVPKVLNFKSISDLVLTPRCVGCHSGYKTYAKVKKAMKKIKSEVTSGKMPKGSPLTKEQKDSLLKWINDGAVEK